MSTTALKPTPKPSAYARARPLARREFRYTYAAHASLAEGGVFDRLHVELFRRKLVEMPPIGTNTAQAQ